MDFTFEDTRFGKELIRQGVRKGVLQGMHRLLLRTIAHRFGKVPVSVRKQIESIKDEKRLDHLAEDVLEVKNLGQFKKLMGPNEKAASNGRNGTKRTSTAKAQRSVSPR